jgi:two-component system, NtrC family, sensor kinase
MSILARYAIATSVILLVTFVLFATVTLSSIRRIYDREAVMLAEMISETIISTTHHGMLNNDSQSVYKMIADVGRQPEIDHVRLLNKDGVIKYSTHAGEIGNKIDKDTEACSVCHHGDSSVVDAPSMNRSRRFVNEQGMPILGLAKGIYNEPACSSAACHVHLPGDKLVGVLDITIPLGLRDQQLAIFRSNFIILASGMLVFLFFFLVLVTHKYIKEPIRQLIRHTQKVSQGDFSESEVLSLSSREMQELGNAFEVMTHSLHLSQQQLQETNITLEERVAKRTEEIRVIQTQLHHSERLASIGEMAAGIAHEINNPLTSVMIFTSLLLKNSALDPAVKSDLETILGETGRCATIVSRLLEFSRATVPYKGLYRAEEIVDDTLHLLQCQAIFHNINVVRHYAPGLPEVACDRDQLKQVFMNILMNAAQAMRVGGDLIIEIAADPADGHLCVAIADCGGGISEENLSRIFNPFFTTHGANGTGLGLSVSYGIISNHGGRIEVKNRPGEGATFVIWLPLAITAGAAEQQVGG